MVKERLGLIPRYNWDYRLPDYASALASTFKSEVVTTDSFEELFGHKPIFTTSGRTSLYVILKSLNLPEGSHVGIPLFCCPVVFDAIKQAGLIPRFIDINLADYNLSASDLKKKKDTLSALVIVHMFGHPCDMDSIKAISGNIPIIEDCAQSLFSTYRGQYTGFLSTASFFSFRSGKYISAGEGSAIFTKNATLRKSINTLVKEFEKLNFFQEISHCTSTYIKSTLYKRPWYGTFGYPIGRHLDKKFNLTAKSGFKLTKIAKGDLNIINKRIKFFFKKVNKQRENALYLLRKIKLKNVVLPHELKGCWANYYQFAIRFINTEQRDFMADYLFKHGIDCARYLDDVIHVAQEYYQYENDCPNAEHCSKTVLVIPHYYSLSIRDLDYVIKYLNNGRYFLNV